jgi:hypothetical protein
MVTKTLRTYAIATALALTAATAAANPAFAWAGGFVIDQNSLPSSEPTAPAWHGRHYYNYAPGQAGHVGRVAPDRGYDGR